MAPHHTQCRSVGTSTTHPPHLHNSKNSQLVVSNFNKYSSSAAATYRIASPIIHQRIYILTVAVPLPLLYHRSSIHTAPPPSSPSAIARCMEGAPSGSTPMMRAPGRSVLM